MERLGEDTGYVRPRGETSHEGYVRLYNVRHNLGKLPTWRLSFLPPAAVARCPSSTLLPFLFGGLLIQAEK